MCRYSNSNYKPHYACFQCRKAFKRRLMADINRGEKSRVAAVCPDCRSLMADMGLDFKPPAATKVRDWAHLQRLFTVGITFHSCGCSGPGYIPATKEKLIDYFMEVKTQFEKNADFWRNRTEPATREEIAADKRKNWHQLTHLGTRSRADERYKNEEGVRYWLDKINEINLRISCLK